MPGEADRGKAEREEGERYDEREAADKFHKLEEIAHHSPKRSISKNPELRPYPSLHRYMYGRRYGADDQNAEEVRDERQRDKDAHLHFREAEYADAHFIRNRRCEN